MLNSMCASFGQSLINKNILHVNNVHEKQFDSFFTNWIRLRNIAVFFAVTYSLKSLCIRQFVVDEIKEHLLYWVISHATKILNYLFSIISSIIKVFICCLNEYFHGNAKQNVHFVLARFNSIDLHLKYFPGLVHFIFIEDPSIIKYARRVAFHCLFIDITKQNVFPFSFTLTSLSWSNRRCR